MDAVEKANAERQRKWYVLILTCYSQVFFCSHLIICRIKDKKVGEGTYAVVYQGKCYLVTTPFYHIHAYDLC